MKSNDEGKNWKKINKKNNNQESEEKIGYKKTNETIPLYFGKEMRKKRRRRKKKVNRSLTTAPLYTHTTPVKSSWQDTSKVILKGNVWARDGATRKVWAMPTIFF